jgi:UDP:flavonoid glycosyltransferase YjiC (YdhE family)
MRTPSHDPPLLFTPTSNVLAHVGRSVLLARELRRRGYRIVFAGLPTYLRDPAVVVPDEFEVYELPDFDLGEGLEVLRTVGKRPASRSIERNIAAELQVLSALRPRAVVVDFRPTVYISAPLRGVPIIALLGGRWLYQYAAKPYRAFKTYRHYPWVRRLLGARGAELCLPPLQRLVMRYKTRPLARACRRHGLRARRTPWELLVGDYNLVLDTDLLAPTAELPANFAKVGPIFWSPAGPLPAWVEGLDRRRPLVYVTLGSTAHADLFRQLLRIFQTVDVTVLLTTGGQITLPAAEIPANVRVAKYLPGERMMALADVVIHHGGAGTVYQTIAAGKPSIAIATHFEQEIIAALLEEYGAGVFLTMPEVMARPQTLTSALQRVLRDPAPYTASLKRLQDDLKRYDGVRAAADGIEAFLAAASAASSGDGAVA